MTRAVLPCLSHAEARRAADARAAEELLGGARRRRRRASALGPGRAPLRARGVRRVQTDSRAAGAETAETAETGAETPRNLDEHLDAEIASPSYACSTAPVGETRIEPILSRDPAARVDAVAGEADARGGAALVPRAARDGARGDEDADAFEDSED